MAKDLFSDYANEYAAFRPTYPAALYEFIFKHLNQFDKAWDCGTGNGQVAHAISTNFKTVFATDISQTQIDRAIAKSNIIYQKCSAESTGFPVNSFDLITVGQAVHWFDRDKFYKECKRVGKQNSIIACFGYSPVRLNDTFDKLIDDFYYNKIFDYWETERSIVEDQYTNLPFPFIEIKTPGFAIELSWSLNEVEGYLNTWSSVKKFIKEKGFNPVIDLMEKIKPLWNTERQTINFPVFIRLGRIHK
jgi:hypothetical protein